MSAISWDWNTEDILVADKQSRTPFDSGFSFEVELTRMGLYQGVHGAQVSADFGSREGAYSGDIVQTISLFSGESDAVRLLEAVWHEHCHSNRNLQRGPKFKVYMVPV